MDAGYLWAVATLVAGAAGALVVNSLLGGRRKAGRRSEKSVD